VTGRLICQWIDKLVDLLVNCEFNWFDSELWQVGWFVSELTGWLICQSLTNQPTCHNSLTNQPTCHNSLKNQPMSQRNWLNCHKSQRNQLNCDKSINLSQFTDKSNELGWFVSELWVQLIWQWIVTGWLICQWIDRLVDLSVIGVTDKSTELSQNHWQINQPVTSCCQINWPITSHWQIKQPITSHWCKSSYHIWSEMRQMWFKI
jgi:hypothetical protein